VDLVPNILCGCLAVASALVLTLLALLARHQLRERTARLRLADAQSKGFAEVLDELTSLRSALVTSGAIERSPRLPPAPFPSPLPSVARQVVSVTRDDEPIHTRPTVERPPPNEPPSAKPSQSRDIAAPRTPRSAPRPVPFEDQIVRAMKRIEKQAKVPPEVEARWEQRLRALGAELGLREDAEPTDQQVEAMIRELYEAEADVKDARPAVPPLEATLSSTVSPIAVRIAQAALRPDDAEGEATLRREGDRPTALPQANVDDDSEDGRDTGEDLTTVYKPGEVEASSPEVKPKLATLRPPHRSPRPVRDPLPGVEPERPKSSATRTAETFRKRPTLLGGLVAPSAPPGGGEGEGGGP
jgi:hypothetical protein